jgi:hypothetical protein
VAKSRLVLCFTEHNLAEDRSCHFHVSINSSDRHSASFKASVALIKQNAPHSHVLLFAKLLIALHIVNRFIKTTLKSRVSRFIPYLNEKGKVGSHKLLLTRFHAEKGHKVLAVQVFWQINLHFDS